MAEDKKEEKLDKLSDVTDFLQGIRNKMRPDLNSRFGDFQKDVQKRIDKKLREAAAKR